MKPFFFTELGEQDRHIVIQLWLAAKGRMSPLQVYGWYKKIQRGTAYIRFEKIKVENKKETKS